MERINEIEKKSLLNNVLSVGKSINKVVLAISMGVSGCALDASGTMVVSNDADGGRWQTGGVESGGNVNISQAGNDNGGKGGIAGIGGSVNVGQGGEVTGGQSSTGGIENTGGFATGGTETGGTGGTGETGGNAGMAGSGGNVDLPCSDATAVVYPGSLNEYELIWYDTAGDIHAETYNNSSAERSAHTYLRADAGSRLVAHFRPRTTANEGTESAFQVKIEIGEGCSLYCDARGMGETEFLSYADMDSFRTVSTGSMLELNYSKYDLDASPA
ncbi:hypothetical protein GF340_05585, partial [Candidatus Peregrinibacteria bacterium]|nr:hypothetical protein [Candidatus Peregrinibacteria bacterium]